MSLQVTAAIIFTAIFLKKSRNQNPLPVRQVLTPPLKLGPLIKLVNALVFRQYSLSRVCIP